MENNLKMEVAPLKGTDFTTLMLKKENHVLGRRWVAAFIDFAVLISFLLVPDYLLGNEKYQETIMIWLALLLLYFPIIESATGYSIGKYICRARVVDVYGNKPSFKQSALRTFFRLFEVNPLLLGGIPAGLIVLFSKKGQRLGDMTAETYVASSSLVARYNKQRNELDSSVEPPIR